MKGKRCIIIYLDTGNSPQPVCGPDAGGEQLHPAGKASARQGK
jgi:hypothetical protein